MPFSPSLTLIVQLTTVHCVVITEFPEHYNIVSCPHRYTLVDFGLAMPVPGATDTILGE